MNELISVIIPVYNRIEVFKQALDSVLKQTYKNIEIIVVDDGSTEGDVERVTRDVATDAIDIKYSRQENKGAPGARNKGFELSRGEYIIFWDADVVGKLEMLEKLKRQLDEHSEIGFSYSNHISYIIYHISKRISAKEFDLESLKQNNYIHSTSLIRRKDVVRWDESLNRFQDWDLWLTMAENGKKGVWVDEYLFQIMSNGTMSTWLPSCAYKKPWRWLPWFSSTVKDYDRAKEIVKKKHELI
jgi:glycosyltransferase involved in cell wall biosynthesis